MHCRNRAGRSLPQCLCFLCSYHKGPQRYSFSSLRPCDKRSVTLSFPFPSADTGIRHLKASQLKICAWWQQGCWRNKFRSGSDSRYTNNKTRLRSICCPLPPATHLHSSCKHLWKPLHISSSKIMVGPLNYIHSICYARSIHFDFVSSFIIKNFTEFFPSLKPALAFAVVIALSTAIPVATARSGAPG